MEWAERCKALGQRSGYVEAERIGWEFLGEDSVWLGRWDDALRCAERNREISERIGSLYGLAWALLPRSWALYARGELVTVARELRETMALAERIGENRVGTFYGSLLGVVLADLGEDENARAVAQHAIETADRLGQGLIRCECRRALAYLDYRRGRWAEALARLDECYEFMKDTDNGLYRLRLGHYRTGALLELGRLDEAAADLADLHERAARAEAAPALNLLMGVAARLHDLRGDRAAAAERYDAMIARLEADGCRLELSYALVARADLRARGGDAAGAAADRARGDQLLSACRAPA
jgi:ATP/maltotriose-dependent transcriptional regulator MalT